MAIFRLEHPVCPRANNSYLRNGPTIPYQKIWGRQEFKIPKIKIPKIKIPMIKIPKGGIKIPTEGSKYQWGYQNTNGGIKIPNRGYQNTK